jgi:hypothetical protein
MASDSRRLSILTAQEIDDLYGLPHFTEDDRRLYFDLSPTERELVDLAERDDGRCDLKRRSYAFFDESVSEAAVTSPKESLPPVIFSTLTPVAPLPASTFPNVTFA